jgi:hypothetical protein
MDGRPRLPPRLMTLKRHARGTPLEIRIIYVIRHQAASIGDMRRITVHRGQSIAGREFGHSCAVDSELSLGQVET